MLMYLYNLFPSTFLRIEKLFRLRQRFVTIEEYHMVCNDNDDYSNRYWMQAARIFGLERENEKLKKKLKEVEDGQ